MKDAPAPPLVRITHSGTVFGEVSIDRIRASFARDHYARLSGLFERELLVEVLAELNRSEFYEREQYGISTELCMRRNGLAIMLDLFANDPTFCDFITKVSGSTQPIKSFGGRVFRVVPGVHHDSWHKDSDEYRVLAMSINLSAEPFRGAVLQLRSVGSTEVMHEIENTVPGDAVLFRVSEDLEHRLTKLEGSSARTAYAGWYQTEPDFLEVVREIERTAHCQA